jgi:hypothetical protein
VKRPSLIRPPGNNSNWSFEPSAIQTSPFVAAAQWVVQAFRKCGINYQYSDRDRSSIYLDALPLFTTGFARLLDNKRLIAIRVP